MSYATIFAQNIIYPVITKLGYDTQPLSVVAFLLGIAMAESGLRYVKQNKGPALSVYQIEPQTHDDIRKWAMARKQIEKLDQFLIPTMAPIEQLAGNTYYATAVARMFWRRLPTPLPQYTTSTIDFIRNCAKLWKEYYNTIHGAGSEQGFVTKAGPAITEFLLQQSRVMHSK